MIFRVGNSHESYHWCSIWATREALFLIVLCLVTQPYPTLCDPVDCSPSGSSVHGDSPRKSTGMVAMPASGGSSQAGIKPKSPGLQVDSLPPEPLGKPMNTEVGSLSLLQGIFQTRNWTRVSCITGELQCRNCILYQLNYQGSTFYITQL